MELPQGPGYRWDHSLSACWEGAGVVCRQDRSLGTEIVQVQTAGAGRVGGHTPGTWERAPGTCTQR